MNSSARFSALLAASCGGALVFAAAIPAASATVNPRSAAAADGRPTARIINGDAADRSQTPWYLQFAPKNRAGGASLCGATKINKRWAVTAAHCVSSRAGVARGGSRKSFVLVNPAARNQGERYYLDRIVVHPNYKWNSDKNDIALLKTTKKMPSGKLRLDSDKSGPKAQTAAEVFGFGQTVPGDPSSTAEVLQEGQVQVMTGPLDPKCGSYERKNYDPVTMLCAGLPAGGTDACQGDSGGPLVATLGGQRRLIGIVSSGYDCALPNYPGIYTRVSTYANWVSKYTTGKVKATSSCKKGGCKVKYQRSASIKLRNGTPKNVSYKVKVRAKKKKFVSVKNAAGKIRSGASARVTVYVKTKKKRCVRVRVTVSGKKLKTFQIATNGSRKCKS